MKAHNFQTYYADGYSFFTCYSSATESTIVQVFKENEDGSETLIDTLDNITSEKIAMMNDNEFSKLVSKYNK